MAYIFGIHVLGTCELLDKLPPVNHVIKLKMINMPPNKTLLPLKYHKNNLYL